VKPEYAPVLANYCFFFNNCHVGFFFKKQIGVHTGYQYQKNLSAEYIIQKKCNNNVRLCIRVDYQTINY